MATKSPSTVAKFQRWVDLMATLLGRHGALAFEEIAQEVPAYNQATDATAKRMFERDKAELRSLGIPIETVGVDGDEESAYRIPGNEFYLPYLSVLTERGLSKPRRVDRYGYRALTELAFRAEELAAVADAVARVRQFGDPALRAEIESAVRKLAFDLPMDACAHPADLMLGPSHAPAPAATLSKLSAALVGRKLVTLDYYSMTAGEAAVREVEPFGLFFQNSNWYLAARERGATEVRNFRVNRVRSCSVQANHPGTADYEIPATFRLRDHAQSRQAWELGTEPAIVAIVDVRGDSGATLAASELGRPVEGHPTRRLFDVRRPDVFARWLLSLAGELVPLSPPAICDEYRRRIEATLAVYE